jgi:hypothetical protein
MKINLTHNSFKYLIVFLINFILSIGMVWVVLSLTALRFDYETFNGLLSFLVATNSLGALLAFIQMVTIMGLKQNNILLKQWLLFLVFFISLELASVLVVGKPFLSDLTIHVIPSIVGGYIKEGYSHLAILLSIPISHKLSFWFVKYWVNG